MLERAAGIEPVYRPWQGRGLTIVLRPHFVLAGSRGEIRTHASLRYELSALPLGYPAICKIVQILMIIFEHFCIFCNFVQILAKLFVFGGFVYFPTPQSTGWGGWICTNVATALIAPDLQSYNKK